MEQTPKTLGQMAAKFHVPADFFLPGQAPHGNTVGWRESQGADDETAFDGADSPFCWMNRPMTLMWRRWNG